MSKRRFDSGTKWEAVVGYSRVARIDRFVAVSGTTAVDEEGNVAGDAYAQTKRALQAVVAALERVGATVEDVIRTRIFVVNVDDWEAVGRAHGEFFAAVRPACSMLEVRRLIDDRMLVEIEADAILSDEPTSARSTSVKMRSARTRPATVGTRRRTTG